MLLKIVSRLCVLDLFDFFLIVKGDVFLDQRVCFDALGMLDGMLLLAVGAVQNMREFVVSFGPL